jgi:hypothetical protein
MVAENLDLLNVEHMLNVFGTLDSLERFRDDAAPALYGPHRRDVQFALANDAAKARPARLIHQSDRIAGLVYQTSPRPCATCGPFSRA